ncbi:hypothetical protein DL93DRAFT_2088284 [Clavulina sp. PMI_390]|nr:hypothetical protein DL93DRAFT_2088284 [Clavulina sp. PMI_390]
MSGFQFDPKPILELDGYLRPEIPGIVTRYNLYRQWKQTITKTEGGYEQFSRGYEKFGFNVSPDGTVIYREWAPGVIVACLTGEFSKSSLPAQCVIWPINAEWKLRTFASRSLTSTEISRWMEPNPSPYD